MDAIKKGIVILLFFSLIACSSSEENNTSTSVVFTDTPVITDFPSRTPFPTLQVASTWTPSPKSTITLTPTLNLTQQTWVATYIAGKETQQELNQKIQEMEAIEIEKFSINCDSYYSSDLSPNGEWLATSCNNKIDQSLVVQNKQGVNWVIKFNDLLHPNLTNQGMPGSVVVMFWGTEGKYLYFTTSLGWSGGGDFCFPGYGTNGLFRLNLSTGSWSTLIPSPEYFPGDEIKFSPTGRRYAVDLNGITVTDLNTGEATQIKATGIIEFIWSPDGTNLAYSVANCNEEGFIVSSSIYIWDALKNDSRLILTIEKTLLTPISWNENSPLKIKGEEYVDGHISYVLYEYFLKNDELIFIGPDSILSP